MRFGIQVVEITREEFEHPVSKLSPLRDAIGVLMLLLGSALRDKKSLKSCEIEIFEHAGQHYVKFLDQVEPVPDISKPKKQKAQFEQIKKGLRKEDKGKKNRKRESKKKLVCN